MSKKAPLPSEFPKIVKAHIPEFANVELRLYPAPSEANAAFAALDTVMVYLKTTHLFSENFHRHVCRFLFQ